MYKALLYFLSSRYSVFSHFTVHLHDRIHFCQNYCRVLLDHRSRLRYGKWSVEKGRQKVKTSDKGDERNTKGGKKERERSEYKPHGDFLKVTPPPDWSLFTFLPKILCKCTLSTTLHLYHSLYTYSCETQESSHKNWLFTLKYEYHHYTFSCWKQVESKCSNVWDPKYKAFKGFLLRLEMMAAISL